MTNSTAYNRLWPVRPFFPSYFLPLFSFIPQSYSQLTRIRNRRNRITQNISSCLSQIISRTRVRMVIAWWFHLRTKNRVDNRYYIIALGVEVWLYFRIGAPKRISYTLPYFGPVLYRTEYPAFRIAYLTRSRAP